MKYLFRDKLNLYPYSLPTQTDRERGHPPKMKSSHPPELSPVMTDRVEIGLLSLQETAITSPSLQDTLLLCNHRNFLTFFPFSDVWLNEPNSL